jgi:hypothetical protein
LITASASCFDEEISESEALAAQEGFQVLRAMYDAHNFHSVGQRLVKDPNPAKTFDSEHTQGLETGMAQARYAIPYSAG